ncbi:MAG TPA: penicillin-binding protein 2 [Acidimicrobiales bacterium]|nr:penicillin-binding protein 2 [Acidimicrobiales bacterium]
MSPSILLGRRTRAMRLVLVVVFVALVVQLVHVQEFSHQRYASLSASELTQTVSVPAVRGGIFDRNGEVLAESVTKQTVVADPMLITHPAATAAALSPLLGVPADQLRAQLTARSGFVYLAHRVPDAVATEVSSLGLTGINLVPESQRIQPDGQLASPVVGSVKWDGSGSAGLEYQYDNVLAGSAGSKSLLQAPDGVTLPGSGRDTVAARPGAGIELTIDQSIQYIAEQALAAEIAASHAFSGTAVVMDVRTGDILAMADLQATTGTATTGAATGASAVTVAQAQSRSPAGPSSTSGPTLVAGGDTLPAGVEEAPSNTAVTQVYEPGSVFKLVTFSAALASGVTSPNQVVEVPGSLAMGTYTFHDAEQHGPEQLTASAILAQSSNLGTIEVAQALGKNRLLAQIGNLGFGKPTGLGFPGESQGLVPGPAAWTGTSIGSTPIGQDDAVTAQQILDAYNSVANGGVLVAPRLVRATVGADGTVHTAKPSAAHRVIGPATDAQLVSMLEGVVSSGTGTSAAIDGYTVAGKTGTAQIPDPDHLGYIPGAYVGSFAGFAPAENPVLSAVVVLDHPTPIYGGAVAAPVFSTIMAYALHHYGIPTTAAATTSTSSSAVGATGTTAVPSGATTEGP